MKLNFLTGFLLSLLLLTAPLPSAADDIRVDVQTAREKQIESLKGAVKAEKETALKEAKATQQVIQSGRVRLLAEIKALTTKNKTLSSDITRLSRHLKDKKDQKAVLEKQKKNISAESKELTGHIRVTVKDIDAVISQSMQSAFSPNRSDLFKPILDLNHFPAYEDVKRMTDIIWDEIRSTGEVRIETVNIVSPSGEDQPAEVLVLGNFTAAYRLGKKTGFLVYSGAGQRLIAMSNPPPYLIQRKINQYIDGKSEDTPIDISRGAGIQQLSNEVNLLEQIKSGGPVVFPIVAIFILALILILERVIYIFRIRVNSSQMVNRVSELIVRGDLDECENLCRGKKKKPLFSVILTGIKYKDLKREDLENILQENIMSQIPGLERFLSTIGMLATISPLLGLLGTVTGMINTFHIITFFGTGDARMMSGGISEALVTTMLGLAVAIPIMFGHTFISRAIETIIAQMEEKAVALINTIEKSRTKYAVDSMGDHPTG